MSLCLARRLLFFNPLARHIGHTATSQLRTSPGQNLSNRYRSLERSLKGRDILSTNTAHLSTPPVHQEIAHMVFEKSSGMLHGFKIPKEPVPPQDDECCMSNCAVCVYDLYEDSLDDYRKSVEDLRASLSALEIPEAEWPQTIRLSDIQGSGSRKDAVISAFEEMERALKKKHEDTAAISNTTGC